MNTEKLIKFYNRFLEDERFNLEKINVPEEKKAYVGFAELNNFDLALHAIYVQRDFDLARNYFYRAAVCAEYQVVMYDSLLHTSIYRICYALLSDHSKVIEHYKSLKNSVMDPTFIGYQFNTSIQAILNNDDELLKLQIDKLNDSVNISKNNGFAGCVDFFEGILQKNISMIKSGIDQLLKSFGQREESGLEKGGFSIETTALTKLAWRKGFEIEVQNSLVPSELLPTRELSKYSGYNFFIELYPEVV